MQKHRITAADVAAAQQLIAGVIAATRQQQLNDAARLAFLRLDEGGQDLWREAIARHDAREAVR